LAGAAAGVHHSVFIDGKGRLSSCGSAPNHIRGLLGHGEGVTRLITPTRLVSMLGAERAVSVWAGLNHSLALTAPDGAVWSWGGGGNGRLGHGDQQDQLLPKKIEAFAGRRVVAVSAGAAHSLALTANGAVWSWGYGARGRLGHSGYQRRSRPLLASASSLCRLEAATASPSPPTAQCEAGAGEPGAV